MTLVASILTALAVSLQVPETYSVFTPDDADHYANGVVLTAFKDVLSCMWQSSPTDEDSDDTWVAYSHSNDKGQTWSRPTALAVPNDTAYCTSGGWFVKGDTLTALIDLWPKGLTPRGGYTYFINPNSVVRLNFSHF